MNENSMTNDIFDLSTELNGIASSLFILSDNFSTDEATVFSNSVICSYLHTAAEHIERIVNDLNNLEDIHTNINDKSKH